LEIHFALRPLKRIGAKQCGPWPWPAAREAKFRRLLRGDRSGNSWGGARAHLGLIWAGFGGREAGGERGQRRGPAAAAAASIPARRREVPSNARCFELLWGLGEVLGRSSGWGIEQG
jgi:hypothetical protein